MRHRASRPLSVVWRRIPRALARPVGTLADLSPVRALLAVVVTLGIGTGAFAAVERVGGSLPGQPTGSAAVGRTAATTYGAADDGAGKAGPTTSVPRNPLTGGPPAASASAPKASSARSSSPRTQLPPSAVVRAPAPSTVGAGSPPPSVPVPVATDVTPPQTSVSEQFPRGDAAVFTFGANEPASFVCSRDGAAYAPCTDPVHLIDLKPGPHTFAVRATDRAGNTDPSPVVISWHANRGPSVDR